MKDVLQVGRRYEWHINNYENKKKNGLFSGEYDDRNNLPVFVTKNGERWAVPFEDLIRTVK